MDDLWVRLDLGVGGLGLIRARFVFVVTELFVCIQFLILITISGFDWNCLWSPNSSSQLLDLILIYGFHFPHQLQVSFLGFILDLILISGFHLIRLGLSLCLW